MLWLLRLTVAGAKSETFAQQLHFAELEVLPKYALDETIDLYQILPLLSYDVEDTIKVITDVDRSNITMSELARYFVKQYKEQKYNDYTGVAISSDTISKLKAMILR